MKLVVLLLLVTFSFASKEEDNNGCSKALCLTKAFERCGVGHRKRFCRGRYASKCMAKCKHEADRKRHSKLATWRPISSRGCSPSECEAKAFQVCGVGKKFRRCRKKFNKRCRKVCLSKKKLDEMKPKKSKEKKKKACDAVFCYTKSFKECGRGKEKRKCRQKFVKKCAEECIEKKDKEAKEVEEAKKGKKKKVVLGCDHHSCTKKALLDCSNSTDSATCRGHVYTECRSDNSSCLAQSFVVCGVGAEFKGCRKRFIKRCMKECVHRPAPTTVATTTVKPTKSPCNEALCLNRAMKFCGESLDHSTCNTEHFHYCMLDCPVPATVGTLATDEQVTAVTEPPQTTEPVTDSSGNTLATTTTAVPCSPEACHEAAKVVCGTGKKNKKCRVREVSQCILHCGMTPAPKSKHQRCVKHGKTYRLCKEDEKCKKEALVAMRRCIRRSSAIIVGMKVLKTCKRHSQRVLECETKECRRSATKAFRECVRDMAGVMKAINASALRKKVKIEQKKVRNCKKHAAKYLVCKDKECSKEARKALMDCVNEMQKATIQVEPFTDPSGNVVTEPPAYPVPTTAVPCSKKSCLNAAVMVCGKKKKGRYCRKREFDQCMLMCSDKKTTTITEPAPVTFASSTSAKSTDKPTKVFFTSGSGKKGEPEGASMTRNVHADTKIPKFDFFLPVTTKFEDKSTPKPGKCDHDRLYNLFRKCKHELCRNGVRAFMDTCEKQHKEPLVERKKTLKLELNACKDAECKVGVRYKLQKVSYNLVKHQIASETLKQKRWAAELPSLRKKVKRCDGHKRCKKLRSIQLVEVLEKNVLSKTKLRVLTVMQHASEADKRKIDCLSKVVQLKNQQIECVSRHCHSRILRRLFRAKKHLSKARAHYKEEKKLYILHHKMLKTVKEQVRATIGLAKCDTSDCRMGLKRMLQRYSRKVRDLQDQVNDEGEETHRARHEAKKAASIRKFKKLRHRLIVKRAGCSTSRCTRTFTRRINLYARIIKRIRNQKASKFHKGESIVHALDHRVFSNKGDFGTHSLKDSNEKNGSEKTKKGSCLEEMANLQEEYANALKANKNKDAEEIEQKIAMLDCDVGVTSDVVVSKVSHDADRLVNAVKDEKHKEKKGKSCLEKLADLNEKYAKALKSNNEDLIKTYRIHLNLLKCNDDGDEQLPLEHVNTLTLTEAMLTAKPTDAPVEVKKDCASVKADLNGKLGKAMKEGDKELTAQFEQELRDLDCKEDKVGEACRAKKNRAEKEKAEWNMKLVQLYNAASQCGNHIGCRAKAEKNIEDVKDKLAGIEDIDC